MELNVNEIVKFYPQTKQQKVVWEAKIIRINIETIVLKRINCQTSFDVEISIKKVHIPVYISKIEKKNTCQGSLKQRYESVVIEYINKFCTKHEFDLLDVEFISETVILIDKYYFEFKDIKTDVDYPIPEKYIFKYCDFVLKAAMKELDYHTFQPISYKEYLKYYLGFQCPKFD